MHRGNLSLFDRPVVRAPAPRGRQLRLRQPLSSQVCLAMHAPWRRRRDPFSYAVAPANPRRDSKSIGRHAHTYEDTAIVATTLDGNPRLHVLVQRCGRLVPAAWREAHLESRYSSIACSFIRLVTRIGKALDKLVV